MHRRSISVTPVLTDDEEFETPVLHRGAYFHTQLCMFTYTAAPADGTEHRFFVANLLR